MCVQVQWEEPDHIVAEVNIETGERVEFVETMKAYQEAKDAFEANHSVANKDDNAGLNDGDQHKFEKVKKEHGGPGPSSKGSRRHKGGAQRRPTLMKLLQPASWGNGGTDTDHIGYGQGRRQSMYFDGMFLPPFPCAPSPFAFVQHL